jgi:hypothetical protein
MENYLATISPDDDEEVPTSQPIKTDWGNYYFNALVDYKLTKLNEKSRILRIWICLGARLDMRKARRNLEAEVGGCEAYRIISERKKEADAYVNAMQTLKGRVEISGADGYFVVLPNR